MELPFPPDMQSHHPNTVWYLDPPWSRLPLNDEFPGIVVWSQNSIVEEFPLPCGEAESRAAFLFGQPRTPEQLARLPQSGLPPTARRSAGYLP
jgi:hypothetical protein